LTRGDYFFAVHDVLRSDLFGISLRLNHL